MGNLHNKDYSILGSKLGYPQFMGNYQLCSRHYLPRWLSLLSLLGSFWKDLGLKVSGLGVRVSGVALDS